MTTECSPLTPLNEKALAKQSIHLGSARSLSILFLTPHEPERSINPNRTTFKARRLKEPTNKHFFHLKPQLSLTQAVE